LHCLFLININHISNITTIIFLPINNIGSNFNLHCQRIKWLRNLNCIYEITKYSISKIDTFIIFIICMKVHVFIRKYRLCFVWFMSNILVKGTCNWLRLLFQYIAVGHVSLTCVEKVVGKLWDLCLTRYKSRWKMHTKQTCLDC
jgi:hypothetical protein